MNAIAAQIRRARPSKLHQDEHCPGGAAAECEIIAAGEPEQPDAWRDSGTSLHAIVCHGLREPLRRTSLIADLGAEEVGVVEACWRHAEDLWKSLDDGDWPRAVVLLEERVDLTHLGMEQHLVDFALVVPPTEDDPGRLLLRDWKTGGGYVPPARRNLQLRAYASGIARRFGITGQVSIGIVQPLVRSVPDCWTLTGAELEADEDRIRRIEAATRQPGAERRPGPWCEHCRAKDRCEARARVAAEVAVIADPVASLRALEGPARRDAYDRLGLALEVLGRAQKAIDAAIVEGSIDVPGYCVGEGRKTREWVDESAALAALTALARERGVDAEQLLELVSPAQAEKLLGTKKVIEPLVVAKPGRPTVVRAKGSA